jgi:glycosyltransferase involved in cell wall biosynthesis
LKILIFINSLAGGGAERVAATLANFWARRRWEVTVVTLAPTSDDFYLLDPLIRRISLNLSGDSKNALHGLVQNAQRVLALRRTIKKLRPGVALSMMSTPNVLLAFASHRINDLCAVGSEHCYPPHSPLGRMWSTLCRRMYGRLSAVAALTHECAEWIKTHSSATCVPVIPNAAIWPLPDNPPKIVPESLCSPERKVLLAVGRLNIVKNLEVLIGVFAQLADKHPDWDLVILGEGPERQSLESIICDTTLASRIFLPGIAGNVGEWYRRADLYVMTSHSEGFPNALAEALAHGLPAVSFDCDTGPRDIIRQGVDGLLVPPGDSPALRAALGRVMGDGVLRKQLAVRASDARERFSVEKIAGMWEELFRNLSDTRSASKAMGAVPTNERFGR